MAFSPMGKLFVANEWGQPTWENRLRRWDATSWEELPGFLPPPPRGGFFDVAFDPTETRLIMGFGRIVDAETGQLLSDLNCGGEQVAWSAGGGQVAVGGYANVITLWDPNSGRRLAELRLPKKYFTGFRFAPGDGYLITVSNEESAKLWDTRTR
jgi:WD40 repeat protein